MTLQEKNSKNFIAKKSLGQNFLHAPHVVGKMIHEARIEAGSHVLEVGPGKGVLTEGLLAAGAQVVAVEKDDRAIGFLQEKFSREIGEGNLTVVHGDILDFDPKDHGHTSLNGSNGLVCGEYIIAANIPYYITGEFLRKFLESPCQPKRMILMLQKEVAKRIATGAKGNTRGKKSKESILSINVKAYGKPRYVDTVPARHFRPVPNVDSAVLLIDNISKEFFNDKINPKNGEAGFTEKEFFAVVKAGFAHKRKVLIKNLENLKITGSEGVRREILEKIWKENGFSLKIRAEELTPEDWKSITFGLTAADHPSAFAPVASIQ